MNATLYWYTVSGKLAEHIVPPRDPSTTMYAKVDISDKGYGRTAAKITIYVDGSPVIEETFMSENSYDRLKLRNNVISFIKNHLKKQRKISEWITPRKSKKTKRTKRKLKV